MDSDDSFATANDEWPESARNSKRQSLNTHSLTPRLPHLSSQGPSRELFYRPAKALPYELINHTFVYFDGQSYLEAFSLLAKLLESGTSLSYPGHLRPAYVPPPQQIALAATLIVYPDTTTRTLSSDFKEASNEALRYLRTLNKIVGPVNADFSSIFLFNSQNVSRRGARHRGPGSDGEDSDVEGDTATRITTKIANKGSLFVQKDDLWHIVGWAFNCSVAHKKRWERWKLFLELFLEILEDDWDERMTQFNKKVQEGEDETAAIAIISESLIYKYLNTANADTRQGRRRILRAIFADGSPRSLNEFSEVWRDENRAPKKKEPGDAPKKRKINVDEGDFGDYDMDEDGEDDAADGSLRRSGRKSSRQRSRQTSDISDIDMEAEPKRISQSGSDLLGGVESLKLRQRFLAFLAETTLTLLTNGFTDRDDLFGTFTEFFRCFPCSLFILLLSTSRMPNDAKTHLHTNLMMPYLATIPPKRVDLSCPSLKDLETYFIPHSAKSNSAVDNAKVSLLVENLLTDLTRNIPSVPTPSIELEDAIRSGSLRKAVEAGIKARNDRAIGDARKKDKDSVAEEADAKLFLVNSAKRLQLLMDILERTFDVPSKHGHNAMPRLNPDDSDSSLSDLPTSTIETPPS